MRVIFQKSAHWADLMMHQDYFDGLPEVDLARLERGCHLVHYKKGEVIYGKGEAVEHVSVMLDGRFKVVLPLSAGSEKVVAIARQGDSFGEAEILMGYPSPVTLVAMKDSRVLAIERSALLDELERNPRLGCVVLRGISRQLHDHLRCMEVSQLRSSIDRVLLYLRNHALRGLHADLEFELPALKAEIAAELSMTPETFSRALHGLEREGALQLRGRKVRILDMSRLGSTSHGALGH